MSRYPKNIDQQAVRDEIAHGGSPCDIAKRLGMSESTLALRLTFGNMIPKIAQYKKHFDVDKAVDMRRAGHTIESISRETKYSGSYIFKAFKRLGVNRPTEIMNGRHETRNHARADEMFLQYKVDGLTLEQIGQSQSPPITRQRVQQILSRAGHDTKEARENKTINRIEKSLPIGSVIGYRTVISEPFLHNKAYTVRLKCGRCGREIMARCADMLKSNCKCSPHERKRFASGCEVGAQFGSWTVTGPSVHVGESPNKHIYAPCRCVCGVEKNILACVLRKGKSKSCGCQRATLISAIKRERRSKSSFKELLEA